MEHLKHHKINTHSNTSQQQNRAPNNNKTHHKQNRNQDNSSKSMHTRSKKKKITHKKQKHKDNNQLCSVAGDDQEQTYQVSCLIHYLQIHTPYYLVALNLCVYMHFCPSQHCG